VGRAEPKRGGGRTATPRGTTAQKGTLGARGFPPSRARDAFQEDTGTPGFLDPAELARKQLVRDRRRLGLDHWLFLHKCQRMAATPFDFLRGSAPLFYEALRKAPRLAAGPEGNGWLTGDLHLENFGVYRPQSLNEEGKSAAVVFDVNDFDDAFVGPQRLDVLRLLTSTVLACRTWGLPALAVRDATEATLDGVLAGRAGGTAGRPPEPVRALLQRAGARTRRELLDARTVRTAKGRRFIRGDRYRSLPEKQRARAEKAFGVYAQALPETVRGHHADAWRVVDVAFRIAGTGSLGVERIAVLVAGKAGLDGGWIFDMKEEDEPSGAVFATSHAGRGAGRVLKALRKCLSNPPRMAGSTELDGKSLLVRRLMPQEDRLSFSTLPLEQRESVLRYLGALTGAMHRRAAKKPEPWSLDKAQVLLDNAVTLAGLYEAAAIHYASLARGARNG
jgi:Uncharacterized protein conserved in bacteria (DUF2252)